MSNKDLEKFKGELSGSRKGLQSGTYLAEHHKQILQEKEIKERAEQHDWLLKESLRIQKELDSLFDQISEKLDAYKASRDIQNRMAVAEHNGDFSELRKIFIEEYGMDADKVSAMSGEELREQRIQFDELEQQKQAVIISDIRELANEYRQRANELGTAHPELAQKEIDRLDAIKYKCAAMGLDYEKIFNETIQNGHDDFQSGLFLKDTNNMLNTKFNKVAPNNPDSNPFLENEKDLAKIPSPFD